MTYHHIPRAVRMIAALLFALVPAGLSKSLQSDPRVAASFGVALGAQLEALESQDRFSGVVLVAVDGVPIFHGAYGSADGAGNEMQPDTAFALASLSKMFTAMAIARLVEDGTVDVDAPVSAYLPDYRPDLLEGVTIHHLLTHTSGLGSFDFAAIQPMRTVPEMLHLVVPRLDSTPGERFRYSNMGYVLLGAVIEAVTGRPYDTYLHDTLFAPLGMHATGALDLSPSRPGLATGFTHFTDWTFRRDISERKDNAFFRVARGGPAGDLVSTAGDLLRFASALMANDIVDAFTTDLFTSAKVLAFRQPGLTASYGYGFEVIDWVGTVSIGHSGEAAGESTLLRFYPEQGITVVVLSNYDAVAHEVGGLVHDLVMGL